MSEQEFYESITKALDEGYRFVLGKGDWGNQTNVYMVAEPNQLSVPPIVGTGQTLAEAYLDYWQAAIAKPLDITK